MLVRCHQPGAPPPPLAATCSTCALVASTFFSVCTTFFSACTAFCSADDAFCSVFSSFAFSASISFCCFWIMRHISSCEGRAKAGLMLVEQRRTARRECLAIFFIIGMALDLICEDRN